MESENDFAHRLNEDGTIDSICLHCFITVATANSVTGLLKSEECHQCADNHLLKHTDGGHSEDRAKIIKWPETLPDDL